MSKIHNKLTTVRVAIYVRVSTHWQIDKDSLPVQRDELTAYAKLILSATSFEIFEDAGYSAKNTDRPGYQQMMSRIRAGEFSHLLVWKLDRISRNLLDFAAMYDELRKLGVTFVSKNEQFDTSTAIGEAMLKIILVFAELERKMTAERVTAVMIARAGNGQWNGGRVPYGYDYDKQTETFSVNENESKVVLRIYELYEETRSLLQVSRMLNSSGSRHRSGKEWTPTTVSVILKNPFYTGVYRYNYFDMSKRGSRQDIKPEAEWVVIPDHHPAIVDVERWQKVIELLAGNRRGWQSAGKTYSRKNVHVFAGLLTCGCCGGTMSANKHSRENKRGYRPSIYACMSHRKNNGCDNKYVSDTEIGPFVLNYIANMIRARASFGKSTTPGTLQKKLLRGEMFSDVSHIKEHGLLELYSLYKSNVTGIKYTPPAQNASEDAGASERDVLLTEHRRLERALARLKSLFLYDEEEMPEKDYIIEKKRLDDALKKVDDRLDELKKDITSQFSLTDDELMAKASYFLISQELADKRFVDYERLLVETDPRILKDFINSVTSNFCIKNGKIMSITFRNGIIHEFVYKDE
jgi:DNA invertase Pin-like site-specific DNA recombinase